MGSDSTPRSRAMGQRFYTLAGCTVALIILWGFAKTYYLKLAFGTPALSPLLHAHGFVMSLWFGLFIVQARLVSAKRLDLHRKLGMFGGLVALAVLVLGTLTAITSARLGHTPGPPALVFLVVPIGDMVVFGLLVGAGLWYRGRPDFHKRLMLLSSVGMLAAAIARIPLDVIAQAGPLAYFGLTDLLVLMCIGYDWSVTRKLNPAFAWGGLFVLLSHPLRLAFSDTELWMNLARWMTS